MRTLLLVSVAFFIIYGCKKDNDEQPTSSPKPISDFGVKYSNYVEGSLYVSDTFQTKFTVTNYGPGVFESGDTLLGAVKINNVVYGLDLIGSGPTPIVLTQHLGVNQTYDYNPGYLMKTPTLAFFGLDTLDIIILLYGQSGSPADTTFPNDPTPSNNRAILRLTQNNFYIVP